MPLQDYEMLTSKQFAVKLGLPESWVRNQCRSNCPDPIPHVKVGKYIRFEWPSKDLYLWWKRHRRGAGQSEAPAPEPARIVRPQLLKRRARRIV
jgi:hypothetical protein